MSPSNTASSRETHLQCTGMSLVGNGMRYVANGDRSRRYTSDHDQVQAHSQRHRSALSPLPATCTARQSTCPEFDFIQSPISLFYEPKAGHGSLNEELLGHGSLNEELLDPLRPILRRQVVDYPDAMGPPPLIPIITSKSIRLRAGQGRNDKSSPKEQGTAVCLPHKPVCPV